MSNVPALVLQLMKSGMSKNDALKLIAHDPDMHELAASMPNQDTDQQSAGNTVVQKPNSGSAATTVPTMSGTVPTQSTSSGNQYIQMLKQKPVRSTSTMDVANKTMEGFRDSDLNDPEVFKSYVNSYFGNIAANDQKKAAEDAYKTQILQGVDENAFASLAGEQQYTDDEKQYFENTVAQIGKERGIDPETMLKIARQVNYNPNALTKIGDAAGFKLISDSTAGYYANRAVDGAWHGAQYIWNGLTTSNIPEYG